MSKLIYVKAGLHTELLARLLPSVGCRALFWLIQYRIPEILNMHVLLHCQGEENVVSELPKLIAGTDSGFPSCWLSYRGLRTIILWYRFPFVC